MADLIEETKGEETEKETEKELTFPEFLSKSFETLFNHDVLLHRALNDCLQTKFTEINTRLNSLEENLKEGFLHYTRDIMIGIQDSNESILHEIKQMQATELGDPFHQWGVNTNVSSDIQNQDPAEVDAVSYLMDSAHE